MAKIIWKVKTAKDVRNFLWELPQNLLGLILIQITNAWYSIAWEDCYFTNKVKNPLSLGNYIILPEDYYNYSCEIWHERGHQKQSRKYKWLYLPIVLIPAFIRELWDKVAHKKWSHWHREQWYYSGFPEKQADELGKVKRIGGK